MPELGGLEYLGLPACVKKGIEGMLYLTCFLACEGGPGNEAICTGSVDAVHFSTLVLKLSCSFEWM